MSSDGTRETTTKPPVPASSGDDSKMASSIYKMKRQSVLPRPSPGSYSGRATPTRAMSKETLNVTAARSSGSDNWIVGDRCYVNGKAGKIAYLGEHKIGPGEWAGVTLDEPTGKHDGAYKGDRYFQCQPNHGVFCKINVLERPPINTSGPSETIISAEKSGIAQAGPNDGGETGANQIPQSILTNLDISAVAMTPPFAGDGVSGIPVSPASPSSSVGGDFLRSSTPDATAPSLKVGDRVVVSGTKLGTLRYLGTTEFKHGILWAGVELDQPQGKNNGEVQGKRYFTCKQNHGLFAPAEKVRLGPSSAAPVLPSMNASYAAMSNSRTSLTAKSAPKKLLAAPRQTLTSTMRIQRASQSRTGSQESLCSIGSIQSSASASRRVRLGVAALNTGQSQQQKIADRGGSTGPSGTALLSSSVYATLQESIKEKEKHVDQLMRERDLERSEMAKISQRAEQAQQELAGSNLQLQLFQTNLEQSEKERKRFQELYEDERKKCEDLQFQREEEMIFRTELEAKVAELEKQLSAITISVDGSAAFQESQSAGDEKMRELEELRKLYIAEQKRVKELEKSQKTEQELRSSLLQSDASLEAAKKDYEQKVQLLQEESNLRNELQAKVADLEKQLIDAKTVANDGSAAMSEKIRELEELRNLLTVEKTRRDELEAKVADLEKQLNDARTVTDDRSASMNEKIRELEDLRNVSTAEKTRVKELEKTLEESRKTELELRSSLEAAKKDYEQKVQFLEDEQMMTRAELEAKVLDHEQKAKSLEHALHKESSSANKRVEDIKEQLSNERAEKDKRISELVAEQSAARNEIEKLSSQGEKEASLRKELNDQLAKERLAVKEAQEKNDRLQKDLETAVSTQNEEAGAVLESARREYEIISSKLHKTENDREQLQIQVRQMNEEKTRFNQESEKLKREMMSNEESLKADLQAKSEELKRLISVEKDLQEKLYGQQQKCAALQGENAQLVAASADRIGASNEMLKAALADKEKLSSELSCLEAKNSELDKEKAALLEEVERVRKKSEVFYNSESLLKGNVEKLELENLELLEKLSGAETKKLELMEKLSEAEKKISSLSPSKSAVKSPPPAEGSHEKFNADKSEAEQNIHFLNAIIATQSKRINDLELKVAILSRSDGTHDLGLSNGMPKVPAPRAFCDICEVFDEHETDDCPQQASTVEEEATHSHHHGNRGEKRPYCDNCEVFGHSTDDCDKTDHETF